MMSINDDLTAHIRTVPDYPKPGIMFRDISTLLLNAEAFKTAIDRLAAQVDGNTDMVAGIEARGFIIAAAMSYRLGLGQLMIRKPGKLPGGTIGIDYELEYGSDRLEIHTGQIQPGQRILLLDDLIATGGTAMAGVELIRQAGGVCDQAGFIIDLPDLGGADKLRQNGVEPQSLLAFDGD